MTAAEHLRLRAHAIALDLDPFAVLRGHYELPEPQATEVERLIAEAEEIEALERLREREEVTDAR